METVDGEVFGGFFAHAWTVQSDYFGNGESFLWKMTHTRKLPGGDNDGNLSEQIDRESDLAVFPAAHHHDNRIFQICRRDTLAAGGGTAASPREFGGTTYAPHALGFGLHLGGDGSLLEGTSAASLTFRNPPLAPAHADGSTFELVNLEAWGFTPCQTEEEARLLEYQHLFFQQHARGAV